MRSTSSSAKAHVANAKALAPYGKKLIDLTPAAIGPMVIPAVNLDDHIDSENVNMVTCGGQARIPIVAAISQATRSPTPRSSPRSRPRAQVPEPAPTSTNSPKRQVTRSSRSAARHAARR
jgi:hypothetical protein